MFGFSRAAPLGCLRPHWGARGHQNAIKRWAEPSSTLQVCQQEQRDTSEVQGENTWRRQRRGWCQRKRSQEAPVTAEDTLTEPLAASQDQRSHTACWAADERAAEDLGRAGPNQDQDLQLKARRRPRSRDDTRPRGLQDWRVSRLDLRACTYLLSAGMSEAAVDEVVQHARVQKTRS